MNILVYDVAASSGGALTVIEDFYMQVNNCPNKNIIWYFVVSTPIFKETSTIKILRFPWVKKSWIHRIFFDVFYGKKLLKKYNIHKILSLQNTAMYGTTIPQTIFLHNCLSLIDYKFAFTKDKILWVNQNIIGRIIQYSLKNAEQIVVQTKWMRNLCVEKLNISIDKLKVIPTPINIQKTYFFDYDKAHCHFFFPADASMHKNQMIILKAANILLNKGIHNFDIQFTINPDNNAYSKKLYEYTIANNINVRWLGQMSKEKVLKNYANSILVFPSFFESYGLPLYEARQIKSIIFANRSMYAEEALTSYENGYFFDATNEVELSELMEKAIFQKFLYNESDIAIPDNKLSLCKIMVKQM